MPHDDIFTFMFVMNNLILIKIIKAIRLSTITEFKNAFVSTSSKEHILLSHTKHGMHK
jgi:hypothetical protein